MKTILSLALVALVLSMAVAPAFADSRIDSLVNLATQARMQVKVQLDKLPSVSDEIRALYDQGNQETELLISAAKQGDTVQAKQHFLSAMKIFKQISLTFSEQAQPQATLKTPPPQATPVQDIDYANSIKRIEAYTNTLKALTAKNSLLVDFTKIDSLIQLSKTSLANNDMPTLEKTFAELKTAITNTQNIIKVMTSQRSNDRAKSFASSYITKIDAILSQSKELGLSEEDVVKLTKAKEEIMSANDPNRIIVIIKRYSTNLNANESANQRTLATVTKLDSKLGELEPYLDDSIRSRFDEAKGIVNALQSQQTTDDPAKLKSLESIIVEIQNYIQSKQTLTANTQTEGKKPVPEPPVEKPANIPVEEKRPAPEATAPTEKSMADSKEERTKQKETAKNQKVSAELARSEARLAEIRPHVDENIKPKFERAESLFLKLKNQETASNSDYKRTVKMFNLLLDQMEQYIRSLQTESTNPDQETSINEQLRNQESEEKRPSKQNQ